MRPLVTTQVGCKAEDHVPKCSFIVAFPVVCPDILLGVSSPPGLLQTAVASLGSGHSLAALKSVLCSMFCLLVSDTAYLLLCCAALCHALAWPAPTDCPPDLCYNATRREKFWGFATSIGPLDNLRSGNDSRLDLLKQKDYRWL
jgi:hypothetical protein